MFKVGDKVLMKDVNPGWTGYEQCAGKTGIITSVEGPIKGMYFIDNNKYMINFYEDELELVRTETFNEILLKQILNNEN